MYIVLREDLQNFVKEAGGGVEGMVKKITASVVCCAKLGKTELFIPCRVSNDEQYEKLSIGELDVHEVIAGLEEVFPDVTIKYQESYCDHYIEQKEGVWLRWAARD
jgi:hypothetical protein